jgi:hypothetical protein
MKKVFMEPYHRRKRQFLIIAGTIALCVIVATFIYAGYWFNWVWTGFNESIGPQVSRYQPAKTLWDWMQLLIIPLVLAGGALLFNFVISKNEQRATQARDQTERSIAFDSQREAALQTYLDKMSELLLERSLRKSTEGDEVRDIARARTLTVLRRLDSGRKASVLQFIYESNLISIIDLQEASLTEIKLISARLGNANLSRADLSRADLSKSSLWSTNFRDANLSLSNLSEAILRGAVLQGTQISGSILRQADLSKANLSGANLSGVDLSGVDLSRANLSDAIMNEVVLRGAIYTPEQLKMAASCNKIMT